MAYKLMSKPQSKPRVSKAPLSRRGATASPPAVHAKLAISQPAGRLEQEADRVAEEVVRAPDHGPAGTGLAGAPENRVFSSVYRACTECKAEVQRQPVEEEEEEEILQMDSEPGATPEITPEVESGIQAARSGGRPLPASGRAYFESRFGRDFSQVRIHTDTQAAESARSINARAYSIGQHIIFGEGQYAPETQTGRRLIAHELAHTVQHLDAHAFSDGTIHRVNGGGRNLVATRFAGVPELEAALDGRRLIRIPNRGNFVRLIQESLLDMGYTLPEFGVDGIFGAETKAAVEAFQRDAGAVLIDGIVGPETMGLLDDHDTTNRAGPGPPAKQGPVPSPRPGVGGGCAQHFTGINFRLANQVGAGVSPAASINIARSGGRHALLMRGTTPATYRPRITINAPSNARAAEFEVGLVQNALALRRDFTFSTGASIRNVIPTPIKDGAPLSSGMYHTIFAENGTGHPNILERFTANGATVTLNLPDTPSDFAFVNLLDNPQCGAPLAAATMTRGAITDEFRTWVVARHRPSGCTQALHHIDWELDWSATVNGTAAPPTRAVTSNRITVSVTNGNGAPRFIQGGRVPADFFSAGTDRTCR